MPYHEPVKYEGEQFKMILLVVNLKKRRTIRAAIKSKAYCVLLFNYQPYDTHIMITKAKKKVRSFNYQPYRSTPRSACSHPLVTALFVDQCLR
jgi:hypothetical protein